VTPKWPPRLDRLTVRLAIGIALLVVIPLATGLYLLSRYQYTHSIGVRREAAELENRILETALRHQMLTRDDRLMTQILEEVARDPEVRRAMVIDKKGVVGLSSRDADVGVRLSRDSPTCLVCHSKTPEARARWVLLHDDGIDVLRTVQPIENRPECHRCHNAAAKLNGILIMDVSLAPLQAQVRSELGRMAMATAVLTLVLLVGVGLHVRHLVLSRLDKLRRTARSIAAGAFGDRVDSAGDDVIASLATDFNNMADATSSLIEDVKGREQQLAGVLNSLDDGLVVLDRHFRVVAANRSIASRLCSYPEALRGRNCRDVVRHALPCREDAECPTARCLSTGKLERATYGFAGSVDHQGRVQEVYASPVFDDNGSVAQVVEVWRDITERVREEQHLAEIERLSSLGVLASGLSHEVNTPLASTLTCSEAILDQLDGVDVASLRPETLEAIGESAAIIRDQVLRCRKITDHFLRFARGIPPAIEPIDLQEVVRNIMALARPTAREAGIDLVLDGNGPVPVVTANTEVVQHVVLNLLVNAIESFSSPGGSVVVRFIVDDHLRLQIRDDGCGIAPEFQTHLFEPFRTQKPRGTGLGLYLSRTFMRRFNGDVRLIDSAPGHGSCVEVVFPRPEHETD
jgi:two-component system, NtrC family, sensor kinase